MELSLGRFEADEVASITKLSSPFSAFLRTPDEATLLCPSAQMPAPLAAGATEHGFVALELVGPFPFTLTGILTQIANPLAAAGVPILPFSSFSTDIVLIKKTDIAKARSAIEAAGHAFLE